MCGIYGYIGSKNASGVVVDGLKRLDYRGYDSWGIAVVSDSGIQITKDVGIVKDIPADSLPKSEIGIGHTRWATHGAVTVVNAHPHLATDGSFALAQNGIVENYKELKKNLLEKGYRFVSETDTEVIVRLIEEELKTENDIKLAIEKAFEKLEGRNTIIAITKNKEIIAARNGSPLVIGKNTQTNEIYISSDVLSFAPYVDTICVLDNMQMILAKKGGIQLFDVVSKKEIVPHFEKLELKSNQVDKGEYEHYMLKEIMETPQTLDALLESNVEKLDSASEMLKKARTVYTIGSGSAGIASAQIAFYLREHAKINAIHLVGADANEYTPLFSEDDLIIAPSQSGETADVLEVLEVAKKKNVKIISYVNMPGSMMSRISDVAFLSNAGPEVCVMSTKVFTSQMAWGYYLSKIVEGKKVEAQNNIQNLINAMKSYLDDSKNHESIRGLAHTLLKNRDIFLLGKHQNYAVIQEGMVKLIEGTYKHAHALPAGDLKHYAITLMEKGVPVIAVYSDDNVKSDIANAISQVKARGATVIGIGPVKLDNLDQYLSVPETGETSGIMNIIPLQLLAYYIARELGNNIDKPRNIAKSVTVK